MKPIAIITSDWHIHKWKQFNQDNRRLYSNLDLFKFFGNKAEELGVPILFEGDLFEEAKQLKNSVITKSIRYYKKHIEKKGVKFIAISGNHDQEEQNSIHHRSSSYLEAFNDAFDTFKLNDWKVIETEKLAVFGIPYLKGNVGMKETLKDFRKIKTTKGKIRILQIHTDLPGALSTSGQLVNDHENIGEDLNEFFNGFDLVLSGHIHKPLAISTKDTAYAVPIYMVGAPQQQNRGDKDCQMGYWILYHDDTAFVKLKMKFIPLDYPKFIEIPEDDYIKIPKGELDANFYIPIPAQPVEENNVSGFASFSSSDHRTKIVRNWAKATGEKSKSRIKLLKKLINQV
jgi:DNA repair exonuclease SbcCD nuclease subunit